MSISTLIGGMGPRKHTFEPMPHAGRQPSVGTLLAGASPTEAMDKGVLGYARQLAACVLEEEENVRSALCPSPSWPGSGYGFHHCASSAHDFLAGLFRAKTSRVVMRVELRAHPALSRQCQERPDRGNVLAFHGHVERCESSIALHLHRGRILRVCKSNGAIDVRGRLVEGPTFDDLVQRHSEDNRAFACAKALFLHIAVCW